METYIIQAMTTKDYHNYMMGGYNYFVKTIKVQAKNKEQALEIAKGLTQDLVFNEKTICTQEELNQKIKEVEIKNENYARKLKEEEILKKNKKLANQEKKAKEMGLPLEKYQEYEKLVAGLKRSINRKNNYEAEINELLRKIDYEKNYQEKREKEIKEFLEKNK